MKQQVSSESGNTSACRPCPHGDRRRFVHLQLTVALRIPMQIFSSDFSSLSPCALVADLNFINLY